MIDTIKLGIPISASQLTKLHKLLAGDDRWQWVQFQNSTGEMRFTRCRGLAHLDQHSYHREMFWDIPQIYIPDQTFLTLELSLPKFWYGHNIHLLYDFVEVLRYLKKLLESQLHCKFPDVLTWQVWRVDCCYAWRTPSQQIAQQLLDSLKHLNFPYKKPIIYPTSIVFAGNTYSLKFYLKLPEFIKNDRVALLKDKASMEWVNHLEQRADGVIRFEATLRRKYLKRKKIETVAQLATVSHQLTWTQEFIELNQHLIQEPDALHQCMMFVMRYTYIKRGVLVEHPYPRIVDYEGYQMKEGDIFYAPAQKFTLHDGSERIHNGGGFVVSETNNPTSILQYFLNKFLGENRGMNEADEVKTKLYQTYKPAKAFRLYATWLAVQKHGSQQIKQDIGDDSYYRIKRDLKLAGCSFIDPPIVTNLDDQFLKVFSMDIPSTFATNNVDDFRDSENVINLLPYIAYRQNTEEA